MCTCSIYAFHDERASIIKNWKNNIVVHRTSAFLEWFTWQRIFCTTRRERLRELYTDRTSIRSGGARPTRQSTLKIDYGHNPFPATCWRRRFCHLRLFTHFRSLLNLRTPTVSLNLDYDGSFMPIKSKQKAHKNYPSTLPRMNHWFIISLTTTLDRNLINVSRGLRNHAQEPSP